MRNKVIGKIIGATGFFICYGLVTVAAIDTVRKIYQAPSTTLTIWGHVRRIFSNATPLGWAIFALGTACLLGATSDLWRPWFIALRDAVNNKGVIPAQSQPAETVSLVEAATQAYETTRAREALSASFAAMDWKDSGKLQDSIVTWYCWALGDRIEIYGNWPPSRLPEKIDWNVCKKTHQFEIVGGKLIFRERGARGYFENLHVKAEDLPTALEKIEAMG